MIKYPHTEDRRFAELEFYRMGFDKESRWRISDINKDFELCNTYPRFLIVPSSFKDEDLESVAKFRYFRRIPTAVWRHNKNGCFIVRSSQPTVGWFGWFRSDLDEALVQSYVSNTIQQQPPSPIDNNISASEQTNDNNNHDAVKEKSETDMSSKQDDDQVLTTRIWNNNLAHDDKGSNGHSIAASNGSRLSMPIDSSKDDGHSNEQAKYNQNHTPDQIDNVHETINDNTLTLYQIATAPSDTASKSSDPQTNGDIDSLVEEFANDVKVTELKSAPPQLNPTLPSTNIVNGNGQTPIENHSTSENSAQPLSSTDSSDNPTSTSVSNDATTNNSTTATTTPTTPQATTSKMLIIDARSYAAAVANRAKGGGCECSEYYQRCEVHFMNLANIHSIRKSYHAIRSVCEAYSEQSNK